MTGQDARWYLDEHGRFVVENYNWAKPFSSFFPGIAGRWGIPLWVYFVNRAQCVSSMGLRDKDNAVMEFFPFNKACQLAGTQGFRTFLKAGGDVFEPFKAGNAAGVSQCLVISAGELELCEVNGERGIETSVAYFPLVNMPAAGLVRRVAVTNRKAEPVALELLDGLPLIIPFGMNQHCVKFIARHIEAMMKVDMVAGCPFFRLKQVPLDIPRVVEIEGGNFYCTVSGRGGARLAGYAVDPEAVFGINGEFGRPWRFESEGLEGIINGRQLRENRTPSALAALSVTIPPDGEAEFYSVVGNTASAAKLEALWGMLTPAFFEEKREEGRDVIGGIERSMFMISGQRTFDRYCSQTFLDNVMRGGLPAVFPGNGRDHVFYLYSRKHGDLERDYNYFIVEQTYLSQGNSHFRDVNQNRRSDVWFMPAVGDFNVRLFFNLIQTDGYNPLVVNGITYTLEDEKGFLAWLAGLGLKETGRLASFAKNPFTPGAFMMLLDDALPAEGRDRDAETGQLLSFCRQNDPGDLHEGFWIDHWTYNLDLIDSYLMLYPDRRKELFFGRADYTFFDDPDVVLPRAGKYVLDNGKVRQYRAVIRDREKQKLIASRAEWPLRTRRAYGHGGVCTATLFVKMLCIIANRAASLDPEGTGVEMEADKPGWNDPMNGLPALLTSALGETLELRRACTMLLDALEQCGIDGDAAFAMYEDLALFIRDLSRAIERRLSSTEKDRFFAFWEESHVVKEQYREKTKYGVSDRDAFLCAAEAKDFLARCVSLVDAAFKDHPAESLFHRNGVCYTYFENEAVAYEHIRETADTEKNALSPDGLLLVRPTRFRQRPLALFLEGPVHLMKVKRELALRQYRSVRSSAIYDAKLRMFKSSESIAGEPYEVGRVKAYVPGWIENESVYMHMEFKFLLELLRAGLHEEFYNEMKNAMPPFLDPAVYGRSVLENSSFIVSSVFPDVTLHGRGFQPRLSGASAELVSMWVLMTAGERPFFTDKAGALVFALHPALPSWLFTKRAERRLLHGPGRARRDVIVPANAFAFMLFGRTLCMYSNESRRNTFGAGGVSIASYELVYAGGRKECIAGGEIRGQFAHDIRSGAVEKIEAVLG